MLDLTKLSLDGLNKVDVALIDWSINQCCAAICYTLFVAGPLLSLEWP